MALALKDPRQFSVVYPESNILINQAAHDLATNASSELFCALIEDALKDGNDQLLSVAYNLAPTQEIANYLWQNLQRVLNQPQGEKFAKLFALPIILVVGSEAQLSLPNEINQPELQQLLVEKNILTSGERDFISGKLYDLEGVSRLRPAQLYQWIQNLNHPQEWSELSAVSHRAISNLGEGVHLRFLLGISIGNNNTDAQAVGKFSDIGMDLLKLLTRDLATAGATIFPLPFAPCALSSAAALGEFHRQEISIAVTLSNLVKKLRLAKQNPAIKLSSQKDNLQIEVWVENATAAHEILIWHLQRSDNFAEVCQILESLLNDMQLNISYYPEHDHDH